MTSGGVEGNTRSFEVSVEYDGTTAFPGGLASIRLSLANIPQGYTGETQTLQFAVRDGLARERAIPVKQDNMEAFNGYANTLRGLGLHYQLIENVSLSAPPGGQSNWTPIGASTASFTGSFNGGGHRLSGLTIYAPTSEEQGLFGHISTGAVIESLGLEGGSVSGKDWVGNLVGRNEGTVQNCYVTGASSINYGGNIGGIAGYNSGTVRNSHATGRLVGTNAQIGGVVGLNVGTVENCYAAGDISSASNTVMGGVVGRNEGMVANCYATGNLYGGIYIGGVVGNNRGGVVRNCYATGNVHGGNVGGVVGVNVGMVENSYATGNVSGILEIGGVVGANSGAVQNCYSTGEVNGQAPVGGVVGRNEGTVQGCVALNPRVTTTRSTAGFVGRVVPSQDANTIGFLFNNHVRFDMDIRFGANSSGNSGTARQPVISDAAGTDGESIATGTSLFGMAFWATAPMSWDFTSVWQQRANGLPILRNVGGIQNPTLP